MLRLRSDTLASKLMMTSTLQKSARILESLVLRWARLLGLRIFRKVHSYMYAYWAYDSSTVCSQARDMRAYK